MSRGVSLFSEQPLLANTISGSLQTLRRQYAVFAGKGLQCPTRLYCCTMSAKHRCARVQCLEVPSIPAALRPLVEDLVGFENIAYLTRKTQADENGNGFRESEFAHVQLLG